MSPDSDPDPFGDDGRRPPLTAPQRVRTALVRFVADLRTAGVEVPADGSLVAAEALGAVGVEDEATVRTALRSALVSRPQDIETFDRLFDRFWRAIRDALTEDAPGGVDTSSLDGGFDPGVLPGDGGADSAAVDGADEADDGGFRSRRVAPTRRGRSLGSVRPGHRPASRPSRSASATIRRRRCATSPTRSRRGPADDVSRRPTAGRTFVARCGGATAPAAWSSRCPSGRLGRPPSAASSSST
jgi:uncharacterized protein with von Willebrand factor type A (vWA) domain